MHLFAFYPQASNVSKAQSLVQVLYHDTLEFIIVKLFPPQLRAVMSTSCITKVHTLHNVMYFNIMWNVFYSVSGTTGNIHLFIVVPREGSE